MAQHQTTSFCQARALVTGWQFVCPSGRQLEYHGAGNAGGTVQERYTYTPFGQVTFRDGSGSTLSGSAKDWVFLHQGGERIAAGDYEFRNRVYSPSLGRWLSNDPLGFNAGDQNWYRAVGNNPGNGTDPEGLKSRKSGTATGDVDEVIKDLKINHSQYKYWICVFSDGPKINPTGDPSKIKKGHAWIGLIDLTHSNFTYYGLSPVVSPTNQFPESPGEFGPHKGRKFTVARCFPVISRENPLFIFRQYEKEIFKYTKTPPTYNMRSYNCVNWVVKVVSTPIGNRPYSVAPQIINIPKVQVHYGNSDGNGESIFCPSMLSCFLAENDCGNKKSVCYDKSK